MSKDLNCPYCETLCSDLWRLFKHINGKHLREKIFTIEKTRKGYFDDIKEIIKVTVSEAQSTNTQKMDETDYKKLEKYFCDWALDWIVAEAYSTFGDFSSQTDPQDQKSVLENVVTTPSETVHDINLKEFIPAVCREERQYAHYLATYLEAKIVQSGTDGIQAVYFEATFLRDIWQAKRKCKGGAERFLKSLFHHATKDETEKALDNHICWDRHPNHWPGKCAPPLMTWMMNAKPDIAVIVKVGKVNRLWFLECKYESPEKKYGSEHSQTDIQAEIIKFLCGNGNNDFAVRFGGNDDERLEAGGVKIVQFVFANRSKDPKCKEPQSNIENLIEALKSDPSTCSEKKSGLITVEINELCAEIRKIFSDSQKG